MKPHVHAAMIKAWADGAEIEFLRSNGEDGRYWTTIVNPCWYIKGQYRVKKPREFPKTSLSYGELYNVYMTGTGEIATSGILNVANAAIKQYIIDTEKYGMLTGVGDVLVVSSGKTFANVSTS